MPSAEFYLIAKPRFRAQPLQLVCELARKAHLARQLTVILARDQEQAEELDDMLWDMGEDVYIPHQIAGVDIEEEEADILIALPNTSTPQRPIVINLRDSAYMENCQRVLEVVPDDLAAREPLRQRWRQYKAAGYSLKKHDL